MKFSDRNLHDLLEKATISVQFCFQLFKSGWTFPLHLGEVAANSGTRHEGHEEAETETGAAGETLDPGHEEERSFGEAGKTGAVVLQRDDRLHHEEVQQQRQHEDQERGGRPGRGLRK